MLISLNNLNAISEILIDESFSYEPETYKNTDIKRLSKIHFNGIVKYNELDEIVIRGQLTGEMVVLDAISLSEVVMPLSIDIEENLNEIEEYKETMQNTLDIMDVLWQNIVLEIPIRVTSENLDKSIHGDGWCLQDENKKTIDPRLAGLSELLDEGKE